MENKGQISAEYLLTVVVILIILATVSIPLVGSSINNTMDISNSADVEKAVNSIANAVNIVYSNGPGAKRTISVYVPSNLTLTWDGTGIQMSVPLNNGTTKTIKADTNHKVLIKPPSYFDKGWHNVNVTWSLADNNSIVIEHQLQ